MNRDNLRVGDLVVTKPGCGYKLFTHGTLSFTRKQISGIVEPADNKNNPIDPLGNVYISVGAGLRATVSIDCLE